ncbi:MAG TPA: class I SAM-dependent methyltransferase [Candidatus Binatia bacterium]|jgi:SAM-dependent methyltransferase
MNRSDVLQQIIDKLGAEAYLEIGVNRGRCFLPIKAKRKIGVDPNLKLSKKRRRAYLLRNLRSKYYRVTSDEFFAEAQLPYHFDVVFVDGLHTFHQAVRDVENALRILNPNGIVVVHDCNPPTASAAYPASSYEEVAALKLPGWTGEWCGDVWKAVCYLRSHRKDLSVFVLDCDYGLGFFRRGIPEVSFELDDATLLNLTYDDLVKNRKLFLNLKEAEYFGQLLNVLGLETEAETSKSGLSFTT